MWHLFLLCRGVLGAKPKAGALDGAVLDADFSGLPVVPIIRLFQRERKYRCVTANHIELTETPCYYEDPEWLGCVMDDDTLSLMKTVCVSGRARPTFNGNSNERLDKLVDEGLLDVVTVPSANPKRPLPRRYFKPTEKGRAMYRTLREQGAA